MVNELGPWSIKGILKGAIRIYVWHFPVFFLLSPNLWRHIGGQLLCLRLPGFEDPLDVMLAEWPISPHIYFAVGMKMIVMPILVGTMMLAVGHHCVNGRLAIRRCFQRSYARFPALLGVNTAVTIVLLLLVGLSLLAGKVAWPGHGAGVPRFLLAVCVVGIGLILTFKLATAWGLMYQPVLFEGLGPVAALKASESLTQGHRWSVFFIAVVLDTCLATLPNLNNVPPTWLQIVWAILLYPIAVIAPTLLYFSLRVEEEGFTLGHLGCELDTPVGAQLEA